MENNNILINKVFKARKTLVDFFKNINFKTDDYEDFDLNNIGILVENEQVDMLVQDGAGNKIYVKFYIFKTNLRQNIINDMISDLYDLEEILNNDDTLIIVTKDLPNSTIKEIQSQLFVNENRFVNIFGLDSLQFNLLNHQLVPEHIKLDKKDVDVVKKKYNISNINQFPTISRFDPPAMAINLKPGDLVKINRVCKNSISSEYYRLCVNE